MKTLSVILLFFWTSLALAEPVLDLRVQPDPTSKRISFIPPTDPSLGPATPVDDPAKAAEGWRSAAFTRSLRGFIHRSSMGPDNRPQQGAAIFSMPINNSQAIGTCLNGDAIEVLSQGEWNEVRIQRQTIVYFIEPGPATTATSPTATSPTAAAAPAREPVREPVVPRALRQDFSGTFQLATARLGLFAAPTPFVLVDDKGKRIAHVDTANIVVSGSLQSFIGKPVVIHGLLEKLPETNQWVLRAHNIRTR